MKTALEKLKYWKEVTAAVVAITSAVWVGGGYVLDEALETRDGHAAQLTRTVARLEARIEKLETAQLVTTDAARTRFQQHELMTSEIHGSVGALRTEVRVRHETPYDERGAATRRAAIASDRSLRRAHNARPRGLPLDGL